MMQEKPAHTIDLRSSITTWASKTFPVLIGLVRLHMTKPGESSSSEMEVQHHHLGIEDFSSSDRVGQTAHDEAR